MQNKITFFKHDTSHLVYYLKDISPYTKYFDIRCMSCEIKSLLSQDMLFDIINDISKILKGPNSKSPKYRAKYPFHHFTFFDESVEGVWYWLEYTDDSVYLAFRDPEEHTLRQIARIELGRQEVISSSELTPFDPSVLEERVHGLESNVSIFHKTEDHYFLLEFFVLSTLF